MPKTDSTPDRIGPYRVCRELGSDDGPPEYLAFDEGSGTGVSEVILHVALPAEDPVAADARARAAETYVQLEHPNIARLKRVFAHGGGWVAVSEHVPGVSLRELELAGMVLEGEAVLYIGAAVLSALGHAHRDRGRDAGEPLIHGSIRPSCVRLGFDGRVWLTGFGIGVLVGAPRGPTSPRGDIEQAARLLARLLSPRTTTADATQDSSSVQWPLKDCALPEELTGAIRAALESGSGDGGRHDSLATVVERFVNVERGQQLVRNAVRAVVSSRQPGTGQRMHTLLGLAPHAEATGRRETSEPDGVIDPSSSAIEPSSSAVAGSDPPPASGPCSHGEETYSRNASDRPAPEQRTDGVREQDPGQGGNEDRTVLHAHVEQPVPHAIAVAPGLHAPDQPMPHAIAVEPGLHAIAVEPVLSPEQAQAKLRGSRPSATSSDDFASSIEEGERERLRRRRRMLRTSILGGVGATVAVVLVGWAVRAAYDHWKGPQPGSASVTAPSEALATAAPSSVAESGGSNVTAPAIASTGSIPSTPRAAASTSERRPLPPNTGLLTVHSSATSAYVYVGTARMGRVETPLVVPCGRRSVALGLPTRKERSPVWLAPGRMFEIACGTANELTIQPRAVK